MFKTVSLMVACVSLVACAGSAGAAGDQGADALAAVTAEPAGANCKNGGSRIDTGVDTNANGKIDEGEETSTSYVCNGGSGATGAAGAQGEQGVAGEAAAKGDKGATGATGATGAQGEQGATGATGATGAQGEQGATGATGAMGATGATGEQGATGATGATGAQGATGATGAQGATGATGAPAPQLVLGQFVASQVVEGVEVTCTSTSSGNGMTSCNGFMIDGIPAYLSAANANNICANVTTKGYNNAAGQGAINGQYMTYSGGKWTLATTTSSTNMSPMTSLSCNM